MNYLLVALGGATGAVFRYQINLWFQTTKLSLPWATLTANVLGSIFFGLVIFFIVEKAAITEQLRLLLLVGFAGAFTTFSTFSYEIVFLMQSGHWLYAILFVFANVCFSLIGLASAFYLAKLVF